MAEQDNTNEKFPVTKTTEEMIDIHSVGSDEGDQIEARSHRPGLVQNQRATRRLHVNIPTNTHELRTAHVKHGRESWQVRVLHRVHSNKVQTFLMGLLLLDVCILFTELFLAAEFPPCHIIERDAISCCPADNEDHDHDHLLRLLGESSHNDHHNLCEDDSLVMSESYQATCDGHKRPGLHKTHNALFGMTICILSVFLIELGLLIVILGPRTFFHHLFYALDLFVVTTSFVLEIVFFSLKEEVLESLVGLLVMFRVWRFVRIGHGLVEATVEATSHKYESIKEERDEMKKLLEENGIPLPQTGPVHKSTLGPDSDHSDKL